MHLFARRRLPPLIVAISLVFPASAPTQAAELVDALAASITISSSCRIDTPSGPDTALALSALANVDCTHVTPFQVDLDEPLSHLLERLENNDAAEVTRLKIVF